MNYFIIAGEASGDLIGSYLIEKLKKLDRNPKFEGVGGEKMKAHGFRTLFPMSDLSLIGFLEVLPRYFNLKARLNQLFDVICETYPDVIVTIDSPGFNFRLAKKVREKFDRRIKIVNYVSPSIWAYKPERALKVKELFDHQLLILPMEKAYYDSIDFASTFVGHPIFEEEVEKVEKEVLNEKWKIDKDQMLITLMPGSRDSELKRFIPIFLKAIQIVKEKFPKIKVFVPTLKTNEKFVRDRCKNLKAIISSKEQDKKELLSISKVGLIKSGTSTIEVLKYNIPMIVAYKISSISAFILSFWIRIKHFALPNILLNKLVVPEFIQGNCSPKKIAKGLIKLIENEELQQYQKSEFKRAIKLLKADSNSKPSEIAAQTIYKLAKG